MGADLPGAGQERCGLLAVRQPAGGPGLADPGDGTIKPLIAEKWSVSQDGLTYTFNLRNNAKWTDGKPVTAADFEYAWKRQIDPRTAHYLPSSYYDIKGAQEFNTGKTADPSTVGVKALDATTLQVTLVATAPYFLQKVGSHDFDPLPSWAIDAYGDKWMEPANYVSNGPFKLDSWEHDRRMVMVRNEAYWGPRPTLQKIVFTIMADPQSDSLKGYQAGELDDAYVSFADIKRVADDPTMGKELKQFPVTAPPTTTLTPRTRPSTTQRCARRFRSASTARGWSAGH